MTKDQMQQVLDALTDARKFVNMGFEADEDVYGVHHNDATDAVGYIEQAIAIMQAALAQPVQPAAPDCLTCVGFTACTWYHGSIANPANCTNGDKYQRAPSVVLWRTV